MASACECRAPAATTGLMNSTSGWKRGVSPGRQHGSHPYPLRHFLHLHGPQPHLYICLTACRAIGREPPCLLLVLFACYFGIGRNPCRAVDVSEIVQRATAALNSDWASDL